MTFNITFQVYIVDLQYILKTLFGIGMGFALNVQYYLKN